jgi:hypothetical protein
MIWTQDLLWKAIYIAIPSYKECREKGVNLNQPSCLSDAAVEFFLLEAAPRTLYQEFARVMVREALCELEEVGYFTFGDIDQFWKMERPK